MTKRIRLAATIDVHNSPVWPNAVDLLSVFGKLRQFELEPDWQMRRLEQS